MGELFDTLRLAIKYGTFAYLGYCGWQAINTLSGKATKADIGVAVNAAVELGHEEWPKWALVAIMAFWAVSERRFRRTKTAQLTQRITELETILDPQRESSALPPSGDTRKEDRP